MADRLKKNTGIFLKNHNRHGSVDDKNDNGGTIIQSTNDSRVEDMLPNVGGGKSTT